MKYRATRNFTTVVGSERIEAVGGKPCPSLPPGRISSLLHTGWIVENKSSPPKQAEKKSQPKPKSEVKTDGK